MVRRPCDTVSKLQDAITHAKDFMVQVIHSVAVFGRFCDKAEEAIKKVV